MSNTLKKISALSLSAIAVAGTGFLPAATMIASAEEVTTNTSSSADMGKVTYVYVDEATGEQLGTGYKEGTIGEEFVINPSVIDGYELSRTEGETSGNYSNEEKMITFYYKSTTGGSGVTETPESETPASEEPSTEETTEESTTEESTNESSTEESSNEETTPGTTEPKQEEPVVEEPVIEVVQPTVEAPVTTDSGANIIGTTDAGNVIVSNEDGSVEEVAPETVGAVSNEDGSVTVTTSEGKTVKIPATDAAAAVVSIMLAGGSTGVAGITGFLKHRRNNK